MKEDCIFCKIANGIVPSATVYEDRYFRVILDISPANVGHALILPKEHCDNAYEMDSELAGKVFVLATKVAKALKEELQCDGVNILQNNEAAAGQTVFHFHMHIIPRYTGDTVNVGWQPKETDSESLTALAECLNVKLQDVE